MELIDLPESILLQIIQSTLDNNPTDTTMMTTDFLTQYGKALSSANLSLLYSNLLLEDLDHLLIQAEGNLILSQLNRIWHDSTIADRVKNLKVITATEIGACCNNNSSTLAGGRRDSIPNQTQFSFESTPESDLEANSTTANDSTTSSPPLDPNAFLHLISKLKNLTSFAWELPRLPPSSLCESLGLNSPSLTSFTLNITASSSLRYDSPFLSLLPPTLISLSLSSLSHDGALNLSQSFLELPILERLELIKTVHVDDSFMEGLAEGAKRLKELRILGMGGTKLTEKGLGRVLEELGELQKVVLDSVEGRFSKKCWTTFNLSPSLTSLEIIYNETGPYKSWTFDHFDSLPHLITSSPHLTSFSISRKSPKECLKDHLYPSVICETLIPRAIPLDLFEAILKERGSAGKWKELGLDFWELNLDQVKKVLDKSGGELMRLKIRLDSPFKSLLTLNSSFTTLRQLEISIPICHTPELNNLTSIVSHQSTLSSSPNSHNHNHTLPSSPISSPNSKYTSLPSLSITRSQTQTQNQVQVPNSPPQSYSRSPPTFNSPSSFSSSTNSTSTNHSPSSNHNNSTTVIPLLNEFTSLPTSREWRRFLKKSHKLEIINWTGRGGLGIWRFEREREKDHSYSHGHTHVGSSAGIQVTGIEFESVQSRIQGGGILKEDVVKEEEFTVGSSNTNSGERRSSVGSVGSIGSSNMGWRERKKNRRMSEVSVTTASTTSQTTSPVQAQNAVVPTSTLSHLFKTTPPSSTLPSSTSMTSTPVSALGLKLPPGIPIPASLALPTTSTSSDENKASTKRISPRMAKIQREKEIAAGGVKKL